MTGSLEGTLWGAFSAVTFYGIGQKFGSRLGDGKGVMGSGYSRAELARATVAHGVAGGALSKLQAGATGTALPAPATPKLPLRPLNSAPTTTALPKGPGPPSPAVRYP